jgi:hypothetical protein
LVIEFLEQLAKLEHEQWIYYSKDVANRINNASSLELLQNETVNKWRTKWTDYLSLSEQDKDKDRIWAKKVLELLKINKESLKSILANG